LADKGNVTALMTAESIVVGFLLVYASLINETVVRLKDTEQPVFTTVLAGFLVYGLVLIAFRSLLLLFESIRTGDPYERNYNAGYDLFLMVIIGSGVYVLMNAVSVVHYAIIGHNVIFSCVPVCPRELPSVELPYIVVAGIFTSVWVILSVFRSLHLTRLFRWIRDKLGTLLKPVFVALAVGTAILGLIGGTRGTPARPWCPWPVWLLSDVFGLLTIVALWMLMIPKSCYADA